MIFPTLIGNIKENAYIKRFFYILITTGIFIVSSLAFPQISQADSFIKIYRGATSTGGTQNCRVSIVATLDKNSYAAGEDINVRFWLTDSCGLPQTQASVVYNVRGKAGSESWKNLTRDPITSPYMFGYFLTHSGTFDAPSTGGTYDFRFTVRNTSYNFYGYESNRTWMTQALEDQKSAFNSISVRVPFTVVGNPPPSPTVNLTASSDSITNGDSSTLTWNSTNANNCSGDGSGFSTGGATSGNDSVSPSDNTTYTVTCTGAGGSVSKSLTIAVSEPNPTANITASPRTVIRGAQTQLRWSSTNASYCTGVRFETGRQTSGSTYVTVTQRTDYGVRCYNNDGDVTVASVRVYVTDPSPTVNLSISPSSITEGDSATLTWDSTNATSCSGSGSGFSTGGATSGSDSVSPTNTTEYTVTCSGRGGTASDSTRLTVSPKQPSAFLSASPQIIEEGESTIISWSSNNALACYSRRSPLKTNGTTSGSQTITFSNAQTRTLIVDCENSVGDSDRATVTVTVTEPESPTVTLSASPSTIDEGDSTSLNWSSRNADTCSATGSEFSTGERTSGSDSVSPARTTTYTVTCTGRGGTASDSTTVTVSALAPIVSLSVSPETVTEGDSAILTWTSSRATSCSGSKFNTGGRVSGSVTISPSSTTTYTVTCTGAGGTTTDTAQLTVNAQSPNVSLSISPSSITEGDSATLTWDSTNATSCSGSGSGFSTGGATSGSDSVSPTNTTEYTVTCSGPGGSDSESETLAVTAPAPEATLRVRNTTQGGSWTTSSIIINPGDQISLRWTSINATSCNGNNFSTSGNTSGTQSSVSEPSVGNSTRYTVSCSGTGGFDSDSLRVTSQATNPSLSANNTNVREGGDVTLSYNMEGNDPSLCTLMGPGISFLAGSFSSQTGSIQTNISGDSTFTLNCSGGSAMITVEIIPFFFDS